MRTKIELGSTVSVTYIRRKVTFEEWMIFGDDVSVLSSDDR